MSSDIDQIRLITRREAIQRVSMLLGGAALVGGSSLAAALEKATGPVAGLPGTFTAGDIAFLDEIAETILPATKTPGAKAAKTGAFMALMVTDSYWPEEQKVFREGMRSIDEASKKTNKKPFMEATPAQRLALLNALDREQKSVMDAHDAAERRKKGLAPMPVEETVGKAGPDLPVGQKENLPLMAVNETEETPKRPAHYFRMMKELALLGYFTSEIGYTQAMRYVETPSRFDPCLPYAPGERAWAPHA